MIILLIIKLNFICMRNKQGEETDKSKIRSVVSHLNERIKESIRFYRIDDKITNYTHDSINMLTVRTQKY